MLSINQKEQQMTAIILLAVAWVLVCSVVAAGLVAIALDPSEE